MKPRFAIASYSFHGLYNLGSMTLIQYFETLRHRYGLTNADIWNGMITSYDGDYLTLLRDEMDERELKLANLCCDFAHVWNENEQEEARCSAMAQNALKAGRILRAESVRIDVGIAAKQATDQQIEACAKKYDAYCAVAAEFGARLGPENHWGASTDIGVMKKLFQAVKADNFAMLLHLGNWQCDTLAEKCACDVEMAPRAMHIHMHYEACVDADNQFPALVKAGYPGVWSVESHKSTNEYRNVAFQLAQVRRVIAPYNYQMKRPDAVDEDAKILSDKMSANK